MTRAQFSHVDVWIFDLDHTLYPPSAALFAQIEVKMTDWVSSELNVSRAKADQLRSDYWRDFGTTLSGMMHHHDIDPVPYLSYVHDIDFSVLDADAALRGAIDALPGRKIVYTNGSAPYAENVLQARGLDGAFAAVYGIEHADFHPKPRAEAFDKVIKIDGLRPESAAMFEDDPRNLEVPHHLGMKTVHVAPEPLSAPPSHIQHHTDDLTAFLQQLA